MSRHSLPTPVPLHIHSGISGLTAKFFSLNTSFSGNYSRHHRRISVNADFKITEIQVIELGIASFKIIYILAFVSDCPVWTSLHVIISYQTVKGRYISLQESLTTLFFQLQYLSFNFAEMFWALNLVKQVGDFRPNRRQHISDRIGSADVQAHSKHNLIVSIYKENRRASDRRTWMRCDAAFLLVPTYIPAQPVTRFLPVARAYWCEKQVERFRLEPAGVEMR